MDYDKVVPKLSKSLLQDPHSPKEQEIFFFFIRGLGICVEHNGTHHPMSKPSPPAIGVLMSHQLKCGKDYLLDGKPGSNPF